MPTLLTQIEEESRSPLTPAEISKITAARETSLSRQLMLYISKCMIHRLTTYLGSGLSKISL